MPLNPETRDSNTLRTSWRQLGVHSCVKILVVGGLFYYLFRGEINGIVSRWLNDSSWSHGFLIPLFSLYFINRNRADILNLTARPSYTGLVLLILGIIFYPLNIVHFHYGYLRSLGMIATFGAVVLFLGGWRLLKFVWLPIAFLIFAVPLPDRYYVALTMPMRILSAKTAAAVLNLVNQMDATANGAVIDVVYRGQRLDPPMDVAEACSGMRLLMAFLALGVAMAYLHYRPIWQRFILLASTVPIALLCNIVRVVITAFIYVLWDPIYAQGIYHDMLGLAMLPLAFGLYGGLAWFMSNLVMEETVHKEVIIRRKDPPG